MLAKSFMPLGIMRGLPVTRRIRWRRICRRNGGDRVHQMGRGSASVTTTCDWAQARRDPGRMEHGCLLDLPRLPVARSVPGTGGDESAPVKSDWPMAPTRTKGRRRASLGGSCRPPAQAGKPTDSFFASQSVGVGLAASSVADRWRRSTSTSWSTRSHPPCSATSPEISGSPAFRTVRATPDLPSPCDHRSCP